jgi:hypothetical protein
MVVRCAALALALVAVAGCHKASEPAKRLEPVYDPNTGKLQLLKYDSTGDGTIDTWAFMDGTRVLRGELDTNGDGRVDRWERYADDGTIRSVGSSTLNDGKEDAWTYSGPDGTVTRIETSTARTGTIDRTEYYAAGKVVRAETDGDGDGHIDKWETYDGVRLSSVAFDTDHRGTATRRIVYDADGSVHVEIARNGDGNFVAVPGDSQPATR